MQTVSPSDAVASSLGERLTASVEERPERQAITDTTGRAVSYRELLTQAQAVASWLVANRSDEGYIGIYLPCSVPAALVNCGITLSGKVAVNLNFTAGPQNCRAAIDLCGIRTVITSRIFLEKLGSQALPEMVFLEELRPVEASPLPRVDPNSTACVLFSSGSTGIPKGVDLTHAQIVANAAGLASRIPPNADDCVLGVLPFFHSFGYTFSLWFPVLHGIRAAYHSNPTDCRIIGELAEKQKATYLLSSPTFCQQYARKIEPSQFGSLKYIIVGAEKLRDSVAAEFRAHFGIDLLAGYGCTELGPGVAVNTPAECKAGSVGKPLEGIEIRIVEPDTFERLPEGQQGMILVNGPSRMTQYHRAPELTRQAMHDGFYITGDLGYVDADGYLYVTDRLARFSKVAGEMVPHLPIEEAIADVTMSFVTGVPDDRRGERLVLLYCNPETSAEAIHKRLLESGLPPLWIPKREDIHAVAAIPVLASGKIDLKQARELAGALAVR